MVWLVGTSGTRSRWLFPLILVQFWLFIVVFIVGYFVTLPSNFVHQQNPGYLRISQMPKVLYSADSSKFVSDCMGVVTLLDLTDFPIFGAPLSAKAILIKPIPMFECCAIGIQQTIPTSISNMLEPICRISTPLNGTTSGTGQVEFNLCKIYGPPGLYSLQFTLTGEYSALNVTVSHQIRMIPAPYRILLNDEAPAMIEPGCNNTQTKTCANGPQNARVFHGNEPVPDLRVVLTATHATMLPHILGTNMTSIRSITRWPALSMLSYGAAMLSESEVSSDSFGFFNFSKLSVLGYTTPTISLAVYFGGRLQLWNGVKYLNGIYWVRESAIRRQFSARMNAPCSVATQPVATDGQIPISPDGFLKLSGKFCSFVNDASGNIELRLPGRIGFIHIVPSFDIAVLDSLRSREHVKHPWNATTSVSLSDGAFSIMTKFTSEGQPGLYHLYFIVDGQIMLSRKLLFPKTIFHVASMFLPRSVQNQLLLCQKLFLRRDACYAVEPFSTVLGSHNSPSIRLTIKEGAPELADIWHVGIANVQARLYILPNNFTESRAISAPNFLPNSLSFLSEESGVVSFPEMAVSHLSSSPSSLQYFAEQTKIQIEMATSNTETVVQQNSSSKHDEYKSALLECDIPTCSALQITKLPTKYSNPFPAPYELSGVNEDLDIRATIFDSEFSLQTSELIIICAIFIKRHLWEQGLRYPSNAYQGSRVCNKNSPSGWSSSRSRPSSFSTLRYVLEPGEYVWFLQGDAALTTTTIRSQFKNQSFFFEGSTNISQFLVQRPPKPVCRTAQAMAQKAYQRCRSNFYFGSFGVRLPIMQFDGSIALIATFQPSLDIVDLYSRANGAMKNMDTVPWWRAEIRQNSEAYFQVNDYMLSGDSEDPADNPITQKYVGPGDRGSCNVLHGKMESISGFSFSKSRNPSVASGSVNDVLANYFYFTSLSIRWMVPEYSLLQCSINGVQSPILELFPVVTSPSLMYQGCGEYPEAAVMSASNCVSRLKFDILTYFACFPIGVTLSNITFSINRSDGTFTSQQQQVDLGSLDVDVKDSVVADPFKVFWLNANEAQVTGLRFSFIQPGVTFLRLFIKGSTQKDSFMLSSTLTSAPDELHFELESGHSSFFVGAPSVPFLWKVSLVRKCVLEDVVDYGTWVPPKVQLFVASCHANAEINSFNKFCQISNDVLIDSNVVFQSQSFDLTFQLAAKVRLLGGSPEMLQSSWRFTLKTTQSDQIVWLSDEIQISFGHTSLKVLPSSNDVCFIGTRCVFELKSMNPFGIPVPGTAVTLVDNYKLIKKFTFSSRFHSAVSDNKGLLTFSMEFQEEVIGSVVVIGFLSHDVGGTKYLTTKNVTIVNIVDVIANPGKLQFSADLTSKTFAPSFHFRSNRTDLTLLGMDTISFLITKESGKDDKQLKKPTFYILNSIGNRMVVLKRESTIFLTDWKGDVFENATTIFQATTPSQSSEGGLAFKFEYMVFNNFVPSGFYSVNFCFLGKCVQADLEIFVKNTLQYDDTFAEAIFAATVCMTIVVFALLPWSFHSDKPTAMSRAKMIIFFHCVVMTTVLQTQVASLLKATSLKRKYLQEFDFVVTAYALIVPISICLCSLQALLSFYDARFNASEDAFQVNEQLAIRLISGQEKTMKLIKWCKLVVEKLKKYQADKLQQTLASRPKRQFRNASLISIHKMKIFWGLATDQFVSAAIPTVSLLQQITENYTPYEKTAFQKVSEYLASPRLLICFLIPLVLIPLLLFLVRVGVRIFQQIVYTSVTLITQSKSSWVRSNEVVSMLDFFNDASQTSVYTGRSVRQVTSDSILHRIMLYFSQVLLMRDVRFMHDFLNQLYMSANISSSLCVFAAVVGFCRFFMVYRKYVHELRERGRRVLIDSKINFAMHKSSSLVPGQFWSTIIGFFVAFLVFVLICMISRWEPLKKYLANAVINPLIVALVLHYVAVAVSRVSDTLFVPNLSMNSLWMPRRRLFSLYEFFITIFSWISAAGSMILRFVISAAVWLCFAPMDFFQQKSLDFQATDRDIVGSQRFIASIGVDHVIDSPLTAAIARLLIRNIDNFTSRSAFDKSKCDPLALHLELQQYASQEHRRFLMSRWEFLANLSSGTQAAADIRALRKPFLATTNFKKLPVTGFGSTENYWKIVKMDAGIRDWLRKKEKPGLL